MDDFAAEVEATIARWHGIVAPNDPARRMAADLITTIKAFEALPYTDSTAAKGSPAPRATQIINHPPTKVEYTQVLVKPEYPCAHPSLPPNPANYRICLIPQPGYKGGKVVNGPFFVP